MQNSLILKSFEQSVTYKNLHRGSDRPEDLMSRYAKLVKEFDSLSLADAETMIEDLFEQIETFELND